MNNMHLKMLVGNFLLSNEIRLSQNLLMLSPSDPNVGHSSTWTANWPSNMTVCVSKCLKNNQFDTLFQRKYHFDKKSQFDAKRWENKRNNKLKTWIDWQSKSFWKSTYFTFVFICKMMYCASFCAFIMDLDDGDITAHMALTLKNHFN